MSKKAIIALTAALLTGIGTCLYFFTRPRETTIAKIDNISVSLSEYYVYLYEQKAFFESRGGADIWVTDFDGETSENIAKQNALSGLQLVKMSAREAQRQGIALSDAERESAAAAAESIYNTMGAALAEQIELDLPKLEQVMIENELYHKLFDETTKDFEPDEDDFAIYFGSYYAANQTRLETREIKYIATGDEETAGRISEDALSGRSFDSLVEQYAPERAGEVYPANDVALPNEVKEAAWTLDEGEVGTVAGTESGYYVVQAVTVVRPDVEALTAALWQQYINEQKSRIFSELYQKWAGNVKVTKNADVWEQAGIHALEGGGDLP